MLGAPFTRRQSDAPVRAAVRRARGKAGWSRNPDQSDRVQLPEPPPPAGPAAAIGTAYGRLVASGRRATVSCDTHRMRRTLVVVCFLAACGGSSPPAPPTPEEILDDGVVTEAEFLAALGALEACVEATAPGAELSVAFDSNNAPQYQVRGDQGGNPEGVLKAAFRRCRTTHLGRAELAWVDQGVPTPEEEAAFYDDVVSCVEESLGVEIGTVRPQAGGGPDTSVTEAAIAAGPDFYWSCFNSQLATDRP